jgi:hemin uptake protein HemP
MSVEPQKSPLPPSKGDTVHEVVIDARQLFRGEREIVIEHDGVRYRLRITRRNKLILQK